MLKTATEHIAITGKHLKIAKLKEEWLEDATEPTAILKRLRSKDRRADLFTFWQRLPDVEPHFDYYMELQSVAAIPVTTYEQWFSGQINKGARQAVRKAARKGVQVEVTFVDARFEHGVWDIINETPLRQGRPYPYYGFDLNSVRKELATHADRCIFIAAYYDGEMVGFIKLADAGQYTVPFGMVSKLAHRDKSIQNALLAKAVEVCAEKGIPFLLYGFWDQGTLNDFKKNNGAVEYRLPRYYIPLTTKGKIALTLRLHHGVKSRLPRSVQKWLSGYRTRFYLRKYRSRNAQNYTAVDELRGSSPESVHKPSKPKEG